MPQDTRLTIEPDIPAPLTPEAWAARHRSGPRRDRSGGSRMTTKTNALSSPSLFFEVYALGQAVRRLLAVAMVDSPLTPEEYAIYSAIFEDELTDAHAHGAPSGNAAHDRDGPHRAAGSPRPRPPDIECHVIAGRRWSA